MKEQSHFKVNRKLIKVFDGITNEVAYSVDGKLDSVSIPGEGQVIYQYNSRGLNDRITLPGGIVRTMDYDGFGQLVTNRKRGQSRMALS
jgi:YD repeat-containing protein